MTFRRWCAAAALTVAVSASAAAPASAFDPGPAGSPDLSPFLPTVGNSSWPAVAWVDTYEQPGHVLYRFDSVIWNTGPATTAHGTFDIFKDAATGHAMQAIWATGAPTVKPDPNVNPTGQSGATIVDLTATRGASFVYSYATGHNHWHFQNAASYGLSLPGGITRPISKIGFCMYDTFKRANLTLSTTPQYFAPGYKGSGSQTWCAPKMPNATFTREGITPGRGDRYKAKAADQWVDVTGLTPGIVATLSAMVNPNGYILETDYSNDSASQQRVLQGTVAADANASAGSGAALGIPISGTVYNTDPSIKTYNPITKQMTHEIPARKSSSCLPPISSATDKCLVFDGPNPTLTFRIVDGPAHGTVSIGSVSGTSAVATYRSDSGYTGQDSFTYTVTDARGLVSAPAAVQITVS